ncbi:hypothetical protein [Pyrococcus kukulkanii]
MVLTKNYRIHDILTIQINTQNKAKLPGLNFPLSYFETDEDLTNPDIILNIGPFKPERNNSYVVDHKYYIKENYLYCSDTANGKASWKVEIMGFEEPPTIINFYGKIRGIYHLLAPDLLAQEVALFPIIELALGLKGYFLAHAGGVTKDNKGILFVGRSGSRKTTIIMKAIRKGYKTLGDERVIVDLNSVKDTKLLCFPIFPKIFEFTLLHSKDEYMPSSKRIAMLVYLKNTTLQLRDVWEDEAKLSRIYLLLPEMHTKGKLPKQFIHMFIANNYSELYSSDIPLLTRNNFPDYILAYSYIFPDNNWVKMYNNILKTEIEKLTKTKKVAFTVGNSTQEIINAL